MIRAMTARLSAMMFLEFFVWGAWYTTIAVYMSNHGLEALTHWPYTVNPIGAIVAPFFVGLIADRYFATEKVFAVLHLIGGALMLYAPQLIGDPTAFIVALLFYNICYMPTLSLANSLSFHNITDQENQFPRIRVFGTIGWIIAGLFISFVLSGFVEGIPEATALPLYTSGIGSIVLGLYAFTLPHTPPPARGEKVSIGSIVGVDALKQLGSKSFYVFAAASFLICIPLAAYYNFTQLFLEATGFENIAGTQTLGQMSEVIFMLLMPFFFVRLGVKYMLLAGMGAWVVRYALFAFGAPDAVAWMIIFGIVLHGICYDFFFVAGQVYVDKKSTARIRGQAQGLLLLITYGFGFLVGAQIAGNIYNGILETSQTLSLADWQSFWLVPAGIAFFVMIFFWATFKDQVVKDSPEDVSEGDVAVGAAAEEGV